MSIDLEELRKNDTGITLSQPKKDWLSGYGFLSFTLWAVFTHIFHKKLPFPYPYTQITLLALGLFFFIFGSYRYKKSEFLVMPPGIRHYSI